MNNNFLMRMEVKIKISTKSVILFFLIMYAILTNMTLGLFFKNYKNLV